KARAIGLTISGSLATSSTANPGGTVIASSASAGEYGRFGRRSWRWGMTSWPAAWRATARTAITRDRMRSHLDMISASRAGSTSGGEQSQDVAREDLPLVVSGQFQQPDLVQLHPRIDERTVAAEDQLLGRQLPRRQLQVLEEDDRGG